MGGLVVRKWGLAVIFDSWQGARVMKMHMPFFILFVISVLLVACAQETNVTQSKINKDWRGRDESYSVGKDEDGNPVMKSDKRSQYENKSSNIASNRDFSGNDYTKKSYRKERWGGDTYFGKKKFEGNTSADSYKKEPWFVRKKAASSTKQSTANNKSYSVNSFHSKKAREQKGKHVASSSNANANNNRSNYQQPEVVPWTEQHGGGLSVKDTNGMLGR